MIWPNVLRFNLSSPWRWLGPLAEPHVLFPAIAVIVLAVIWGTTINLIKVERANVERTVAASTLELVDTYEAQMLRNLREIDQTLKVVKYAYEAAGRPSALQDLKQKGLLPPDLLFVISISDSSGKVLASTRALERGLAEESYKHHLSSPDLWISRPRKSAKNGEWKLEFSRGLSTSDAKFAGIVMLSVDASYFVSGYEKSKLGDHGVLGLVGTEDRLFRVRRTGDVVFSGDAATNQSVLPPTMTDTVRRAADAWDGVTRFTSTRPLYAFPLTLTVGVSEDEQLASTRANIRSYLFRATLASVVLLLFIGALGRVTWKLSQTARRENDAKLAHAERIQDLAYRDALTGLPNRAFFSKMLEQGINQARRYERALAVLFLDLDRFKQINDTLGHQAGDELLRELAKRLQSCLRESDTIARFGGDEFVVLLPEFEEEKYLAAVAKKLMHIVAQPFPLLGQSLIGTTSIGIAVYPRDGHDEQTLMKYADTAMYHAKAQGKNNFQFYSKQLQVNSLKRLKLETSLRQALERNELHLHYQPKIDLLTNTMTGMETLVRWESPEHGNVSPVDFIPIAEDTGLIVSIGKWVLETACAQNAAWQRQGFPAVCVAVNLSGRQFTDENLLADITATLERTGLEPRLLELEITESMLMHNVEKAIRTLAALGEMKVRLAIDDFGTGYSSLANLKRFPLNTLKIDRSFVNELPHDVEDRVITEAIIGMGKALSLTIVAEGVEKAEQAKFLRDKGCDEYQGYYFSKPLPADKFAELLSDHSQPALTIQPVTRSRGRSIRRLT